MLPEAGATELIFLAAVALIVVGPKDLPVLMRKVGQWIAKMRGLAAEFRSSFDELARQSELDELRKEVDALRAMRIPDPLTNLHPTFDEVSAGLDPSGFRISEDPIGPTVGAPDFDPHREYPATAPEPVAEPPAKPVRARKPKAAAVAAPEAAKPRAKPKAPKGLAQADTPARVRAKRKAQTAEAEG
ncbi:MAG TPA: Sec-independent protein translocase protein TatB [Caulobacteraceae bacterium]|jgi:sec-independent protein translocase protein TatB|nr:Sec-independent protein translocase protein TatB [Caulobacteraceae bacterium]